MRGSWHSLVSGLLESRCDEVQLAPHLSEFGDHVLLGSLEVLAEQTHPHGERADSHWTWRPIRPARSARNSFRHGQSIHQLSRLEWGRGDSLSGYTVL